MNDFSFIFAIMRTFRSRLIASALAVSATALGIVPASAEPTDALSVFLQQNGWGLPHDSTPVERTPPAHSSLVVHAMGFVGVPYRLGGSSFEEGFDCSGFVQAAFQQSMGIGLPRRVVEQAQATQPIQRQELQPGDLVFFNTLGPRYSHVGIYVGGGRFIHSPRSGANVRLENMRTQYWTSRYTGARRVAPNDVVASAQMP